MVTLQIGHQGATDAVVQELREQVKRRKVVKVKHFRSTKTEGSKNQFWIGLAARAGVHLLEVRGHTAVFVDPAYRTGKAREQPRTLK